MVQCVIHTPWILSYWCAALFIHTGFWHIGALCHPYTLDFAILLHVVITIMNFAILVHVVIHLFTLGFALLVLCIICIGGFWNSLRMLFSRISHLYGSEYRLYLNFSGESDF